MISHAALASALRLCAVSALLAIGAASAAPVRTEITHELDGTTFKSVLIHDDASGAKRPALVLIPNWMGINEANLKQAELVAGKDYVVLVADLYGADVRPVDAQQAGAAAGKVKGDRALMQKRVNAALELLLAQKKAPIDVKRLGALGFCFGGTAALELARSGAQVAGVVSFHGGLSTPDPSQAKHIKSKVLVLHGADDPYVPDPEVQGFVAEMKSVPNIDWQLVSFGGAVHSFTDVDAKAKGQAMYDAKTAARAYRLMRSFFSEAFAAP